MSSMSPHSCGDSASFGRNRMSECTKAEDEDDAFGCAMACWCFVSNGEYM
jgi:hypothetical protein